jgi:hypothetical protein
MKWNRIIGKVLKRPEKPATRAAAPRRAAPRSKKSAAPERGGATEDQWLRVLEEAEPDHNPYDTYTWELDPGTEERRLKRKRFGATDTHPPKDATGGMNPYDTGVFRGGGWDG